MSAHGSKSGGKQGSRPPPLVPVSRDGMLPLSLGQQRLWFIDPLAPGSIVYNAPFAARLKGPLEPVESLEALSEAERVPAARRCVEEEARRPFDKVGAT